MQLASEKQRETAINALLGGYRACGLTADKISDRQLIEDYVRKNAAAACNVLMASPVFYFMFAKIYQEPLSVCLVRSITGSVRIVPFMFSFYAFFALICPYVTQALMQRGQTYEEASGTAGIAVMLSGFVFVEALVELRGCGVTFSQMTVRAAAAPADDGAVSLPPATGAHTKSNRKPHENKQSSARSKCTHGKRSAWPRGRRGTASSGSTRPRCAA